MILADLVTCWSAARSMSKAELEQKATAAAAPSSTPPFVPTRTYNLMASAYKSNHGKKPDSELPGEPLMAKNMQMVEPAPPARTPLLRSPRWKTAKTR